LRAWGIKLIWLVLVGILLGYCYQAAVPRLYRPETRAGFWLGAVHGFLMPVALPNLLAGQDVPIFAANNTGRNYKLGYIGGINLCGLIFFGVAFRPQKPKNPMPIGSSP
jgi:Mg/Co/Ni transporter MgtE